MRFQEYKVTIPEGESRGWIVERFEVPDIDVGTIRLAMEGRPIRPGIYTRLLRKPASRFWNQPIMSDTKAEILDFLPFLRMARGRVLINGLGLGVVLKALLSKPEVQQVDVVEISQDLIDLVGPHYACDRVTIWCGDAHTIAWPTGTRWDAIWHDIWDTISDDNLDSARRLHRKYRGLAGWQASWAVALDAIR